MGGAGAEEEEQVKHASFEQSGDSEVVWKLPEKVMFFACIVAVIFVPIHVF